jgi:hypothetical protein
MINTNAFLDPGKFVVKKTLPRGGKREGQPEGGSELFLSFYIRELWPAMDKWEKKTGYCWQ